METSKNNVIAYIERVKKFFQKRHSLILQTETIEDYEDKNRSKMTVVSLVYEDCICQFMFENDSKVKTLFYHGEFYMEDRYTMKGHFHEYNVKGKFRYLSTIQQARQ